MFSPFFEFKKKTLKKEKQKKAYKKDTEESKAIQ